jgi:hypothetical protein
MSGVPDLLDFLKGWLYDPDNDVCFARGANGRDIIMVRQPMGLDQYEVDGRPDGQRMHGVETVLDFHRARIRTQELTGAAPAFELTAKDCAELFHEATIYYHRLTFLFRLKDWTRAERDAEQILRLLEFVRQHAQCAEDRVQLDPWRPRIARIHAAAQAMILLDKRQIREARETARVAIGLPGAADNGLPDHGEFAAVLLESVRGVLATGRVLPANAEVSFIRQDDYWTIRYHGHTAFLKSTRGLHCLACLLRTPGREFHVCELLANLPEASTAASAFHARGGLRGDGVPLVMARLNDASPILDAQTKAESKRRLHDLRQELAESEQCNDPSRAAKAQEEMNAIAQLLASAVGLGGRDRKTSCEAERARCAVTKRIKQAIQKIGDAMPALAHHLTARIKTGYFCSYNPHPDHPMEWKC